jgi:hypothetical protein
MGTAGRLESRWIVNVYSGQQDQKKVIDFYGRLVLPELAKPPTALAH